MARKSSGRPAAALIFKVALAATAAFTLSACTELTQLITRAEPKPAPKPEVAAQPVPEEPEPIPQPQEKKPKPGKLYEWSGDGRKVSRIVINTDEQKARFYDGAEQIGWTTVASGVSKHPTPVGEFEVLEKIENKRSNLYGKIYSKGGKVIRSDAKTGRDAIPSGARFEGAKMPYFMRVTYDGIGLHAGPIPRPGRPASHGCIRMPSKMAPVLFEHVGVGTKVTIVGKGPDYGNYVKKQRALAAQQAKVRNTKSAASPTATAAAGAASQPRADAPASSSSTESLRPEIASAAPVAAVAAAPDASSAESSVGPEPAPQQSSSIAAGPEPVAEVGASTPAPAASKVPQPATSTPSASGGAESATAAAAPGPSAAPQALAPAPPETPSAAVAPAISVSPPTPPPAPAASPAAPAVSANPPPPPPAPLPVTAPSPAPVPAAPTPAPTGASQAEQGSAAETAKNDG